MAKALQINFAMSEVSENTIVSVSHGPVCSGLMPQDGCGESSYMIM